MDDWTYLRNELDRLEGRTFRFGTYCGWSVEQVARVDRGYLLWTLNAVPLRPEIERSILRALSCRPGYRSDRVPRRYITGEHFAHGRQRYSGAAT